MGFNRRRFAALGVALTLIAVATPSSVRAFRKWRAASERIALSRYLHDPKAGDEGWSELFDEEEEEEREGGGAGEPEGDDPRRRQLSRVGLWGTPTAEAQAELVRIAHEESTRWRDRMPQAARASPMPDRMSVPPPAQLAGASWMNIGPTSASFQWNAVDYDAVDSGRPNSIVVNPLDPAQVYVATSGGGIWKTFNFGATDPTWIPVGETLGNMAVGALTMDPQHPDTLYAGLGDFVDVPGGQVVKTIDGAGTWSTPVALSGSANGVTLTALRIRDLRVDAANPNIVLVATDVGLFRSTNAGASFSLVDLPNAGATQVAEGIWSVVYTGEVGGVSRWVASGVYACGATFRPPDPGAGVAAGGTTAAGTCTLGNLGDIWTSTDAGATWTSRKAAGALPARPVGRITLAGGTPAAGSPPVTVIYAQLGVLDEGEPAGAGYWRSTDSGQTFAVADGALLNPTENSGGGSDCPDVNVNGQQDWYNQALAVDPEDSARVLSGGMLCSVRTSSGLNAAPRWELVSHWLPEGGGGLVTGGKPLPYVHADWHAVTIVRIGEGYRVLAGTDGGVYWSDNVFTAAPHEVVWHHANKGMVTHLAYSVASGDPANGDPFVAYAGLQDNGTRFRHTSTNPTVFNQVIGGDGLGAVANRNPTSGNAMYWASVNGRQVFCRPSGSNNGCNQGGAWADKPPRFTCSGDSNPFNIKYAYVPANPAENTFLTGSNRMVWRASGTGAWIAVSPCMTVGGTAAFVRSVAADPGHDGVYGAAMSGGRFAVTTNCAGAATACTWDISAPIGLDVNGSGGALEPNEALNLTSAVAFPPGAVAGKNPGDVYLAATSASLTTDAKTLIPAAMGHLFKTENKGVSFVPFHGNGTGKDLPNVGINVLRFDPGDTTNNTIYAGTQLGVYRSSDGGATWERYGVGLPLVSVTDLFVGRTGQILRVSTYGRGLWEIYPNATERAVAGDGDWDRDLKLDAIDLAAMASRLGRTPATAAQPYYDWNVDVTGGQNQIDEADLSALLTKFGGRP